MTDNETKQFLEKFLPIGKQLNRTVVKHGEIDEHGRSFSVASRKTAKAEVWLVPGNGQIYINGQKLHIFFPEIHHREDIVKPFESGNSLGFFNVWGVVHGGGQTGKAQALAVAIARGLVVHKPELSEKFKEGNCALYVP